MSRRAHLSPRGADRRFASAAAGAALAALLIGVAPPARASAAAGPGAAAVDSAFLHQYAATYRFTLGRPAGIQVTPAGDAVTFLRSGPRSLVRDLYVYDVASRTERLLMTADSLLAGGEERLTREERATRERKRMAARGIADYQLSRDGRQILVPLSGRLFVLGRERGVRELASPGGPADAAQLSPDARRVACVRDGDLYVLDVASGRETRLTRRDDPRVTHGLAEFIAQEEMDRHEGFWWSPDSRWIAYERSDTRDVERLYIADPAHPEREPDAWPYPRAGARNAQVSVGVVAAEGGPTTWVTWDTKRYPYVARVSWEENAPLTLLVQNRAQTEERLLEVDAATGKTTSLWVERDAAWVNLWERTPAWLPDGSGFLWITERGGAPQLELHDRRGRRVRAVTAPELGLRALLHVDTRGMAWVLAGADPTEQHLVRVPLDPAQGAPRQVTSEAGVYTAAFAREGGLYVLDLRTATGAWRQELWTAEGERISPLRPNHEEPGFLPEVELARVGPAPGLWTAVIRPRDFDPRKRYPVIEHVYGGPHSQMVMADRRRYLLDQWMADRGYVVVCVDGRGTPGRGRAWERVIRGDFMSRPLEDHVAALRALGARHPELDLGRVGIWGWSFGGYFAAMAAMRRPDVYRAAVAGGPVVDWRDYDTHYTERYLGMPQARAAAYDSSSVLTYVPRLTRPLLIVHGTADDNVYLLHSLKLCEALNRAGKDYEFLPLVNQTHMVIDPSATVRLYTRLIRHFDQALASR